MNSKRAFFIMLGVIGLLVLVVIASVVVGDIYLHKQSDKLLGLKLDNQVIEAQQTSVVQAKKDLQKYAELESIAKQIVPQDKDQARATREILTIAAGAGVKIATITFPTSTLGAPQPGAAAASGSASGTPTVPAPTLTQVKPVDGISGLYELDIIVTSDTATPATYPQLVDFLSRLEQNRRTAQVSQINITPDSQNRNGLNFSLTITVYIKP